MVIRQKQGDWGLMTGGFKAISRWSAKRHHGEAAAKKPSRQGWQPPACERCPLGQAGLFPVFFYPQISQIFADWFYQFFICVSLRHLRIYCSVSDRSPVCCVSGRPRLAKRVCGGLSPPLFLAGILIRFSVFGFFCLTLWRNSFSNPGHFYGNETVGGAASC